MMHSSIIFKQLADSNCNFLSQFDKDSNKAIRHIVIQLILATDMAKHFEIVAAFDNKYTGLNL